MIAGLLAPDGGRLVLNGQQLATSARRRVLLQRRQLQLIFQNQDASLNPTHTLQQLIGRPISLLRPELSRSERERVVCELLDAVKLPVDARHRRPAELSGGQRQRVAIARALAADPEVLLCDEITSALDVSVQASILELLADLQSIRALAMIFVTHDLGVLRALADDMIVMRGGEIIEHGPTASIMRHPMHEYTQELIRAVPELHQLNPESSVVS